MAKRLLSLMIAAVVLAAWTPLSTTASAAQLTFRIPFSFAVHGRVLPPGAYSTDLSDGVLKVNGLHKCAMVITSPGSSRDTSGVPKAVFLKTGDRYDLIELWSGDGRVSAVPLSRRQMEERASLGSAPSERIVIAAR